MVRHADLFFHHGTDQVPLENDAGDSQAKAEQPVEHGRFPFDEGFVVQQQRGAAEDDNDDTAGDQHVVHFAVPELDPADLYDGGGDSDCRGDIDVVELESGKKQNDREEVEQKLHLIIQT